MERMDISTSLKEVRKNVEQVMLLRKQLVGDVCIVAVSKTKPKSMIIDAYNSGQHDFGENYVNELVEKAFDAEILEFCPEIKWHFIGHLQSNKVNKLLGCPNLHMIHTIDSPKLADVVNKAWANLQKSEKFKVMIQVNTSGEDSKSGISPDEVVSLSRHVIEECSSLSLVGLMLIGYAEYDIAAGPNPEFQMLVKIKDVVCEKFGIDPEKFGLSMGMSHDYQHAIELGSNYVRVGSSIFGARAKKM